MAPAAPERPLERFNTRKGGFSLARQQGVACTLPIASTGIVGRHFRQPQERPQQFATVDGWFTRLGVHQPGENEQPCLLVKLVVAGFPFLGLFAVDNPRRIRLCSLRSICGFFRPYQRRQFSFVFGGMVGFFCQGQQQSLLVIGRFKTADVGRSYRDPFVLHESTCC